jgi:hypothetical protein
MKDAHGHGSDGRGSFGQRQPYAQGRNLFSIAPGASFKSRPKTDAKRTVEDLRNQMRFTGPGHRTGLMQGIKNLLGG